MQYQVLQINIVRHHKNCIADSKEKYSRDLGIERVNIQVLIPLCLAKYG